MSSTLPILKYQRVSENVRHPTRATAFSAGLDLYMLAPFTIIPPHATKCIDTGLQFSFPANTYGRIASKSGLALHNSILVLTGVIDPDYRGTVHIILHNLSNSPVLIPKKQACAQIILENFILPYHFETIEAADHDDDDGIERGSRGFGECENYSL